ncbi:MAG: DUF4349 domain-containing protein [Candidatus Aenigmatarchaeota archaeon]
MNIKLPEEREYRLAIAAVAILGLGALGVIGSLVPQAGSMQEQALTTDKAVYDSAPKVAASGGRDAGAVEGRKKATSVRMTFEVASVQDALTQVKEYSKEYSGIVESTYFNKEYGSNGHVTVRIPQENSSVFEDRLENRWNLKSSSTNTDDVTDRYTELTLELENKRQELRKLEEMINSTDEVESLIKIQERMSELRSRIQFLENQLSDLDKRTEYVRYSISFQEHEQFTSEFEVRKTFTNAYRAVFDSLRFIIVGAGYLVPFILLYLAYRGFKRFRGRLDLF